MSYLGGEDEPGLVGAGPAHLEVEVGELLQETIVHLDTGRSHPHTSGLHVGNCCRLNKAFVWPRETGECRSEEAKQANGIIYRAL